MPHGYSVREAVNESEVHQALCLATKGYGGLVRFVRRFGLCYKYVQGMLYGDRRMSVEVAGKLGYELRWVRVEKGEQANGLSLGNSHQVVQKDRQGV